MVISYVLFIPPLIFLCITYYIPHITCLCTIIPLFISLIRSSQQSYFDMPKQSDFAGYRGGRPSTTRTISRETSKYKVGISAASVCERIFVLSVTFYLDKKNDGFHFHLYFQTFNPRIVMCYYSFGFSHVF